MCEPPPDKAQDQGAEKPVDIEHTKLYAEYVIEHLISYLFP
jgi:hypothetical protein